MANDGVKKGSAFDMWSIPHFIFGILTAFVPALTGLSLLTAFTLTLILAMLWEIYEKFMEIKESVQNSVIDIVLPLVAFVITSYVLIAYPLNSDELLVATGAFTVLYL